MPQWLANDPSTLYWILGALALVVLVITFLARGQGIQLGSSRDRRKEPRSIGVPTLGGAILLILATLAGFIWLIDKMVVTDEELIVDAVQEMAEGVKARDTERVFRQVSDEFGSDGKAKENFKAMARVYIEQGDVSSIKVWDFEFEKTPPPSRTTRTVQFMVKVEGSYVGSQQTMFYRCEAVFQRDADGKWRLKSYQLLNPVTNEVEQRFTF